MPHLLAWFANNSNATLAALAGAASESIASASGANRYFVPPGLTRVHWGAALGTTLTRAKIITPSLQQMRSDVEVMPRRKGGVALTLAQPEIWIPRGLIPVVPQETIEADIAQASGGAEDEYVFVNLMEDQPRAIPAGPMIVARGTSSTTLVAKAWSKVTITLDSDLPVGTYELAGFIAISATAIAARAIIPGINYRPGLPAFAGTESAALVAGFSRMDALMTYSMGAFIQQNIPAFEFFSSAADTAEEVFLFLVRAGG